MALSIAPDEETWTTAGAPGINPKIRKCPACAAVVESRTILGGGA